MRNDMTELRSNLGRKIDPSLPSNRRILTLTGAYLACATAAGLLRGAPDESERATLEAIRAGDGGVYERVAGALLAPISAPTLRVRALRAGNALIGALGVFTTWALAREILPDQPDLAAPAAALAGLNPAIWRLATHADPLALEMLNASGILMIACRIASGSVGPAPTTLDQITVAAGGAFGALAAPELAELPALLALALGYAALRQGDRMGALRGSGAALSGMLPAALLRRGGRVGGMPEASRRALGIAAAGGLLGTIASLALRGGDAVRSRADDGTPMANEAVQATRGLALGWVALRLARRDERAALDVLAPLCCGIVAGVAALAQALSGDDE